MKKLLAAALLISGLSSCISLDYIGKSYTPRQDVNMYFDVADVPAEYEVIGLLSAEAPEIVRSSRIQEKMLAKAAEMGADAVLFEYMDKKISGTTSSGDSDPFGYYSNTQTLEDKVVQAKLIRLKS